MKIRYFADWDWEYDCGRTPLPDDLPPPASHALVRYNWLGYPYRVEVHNPVAQPLIQSSSTEPLHYVMYDYIYDAHGHLCERRTYDDEQCLQLISRYAFHLEANRLVVTSWQPAGENEAQSAEHALSEWLPNHHGESPPSLAPPSPAETSQQLAPPQQEDEGEEQKPFLRRMRPDAALALIESGTRQSREAGAILLDQGQVNDRLYIVRKGLIAVVATMDGQEVELATLGAGEVVGEMSLLSGEPCNARVITKTPADFVEVPSSALDKVMAHNPALHRWFSHLFVERMRDTDMQLADRLVQGMSGRLSMIGLLDLVQTLLMSRQSGKLILHNASESGYLLMQDGQILDAIVGELRGDNAFYHMARWSEGSFSFSPAKAANVTPSVSGDTMHLMMEAARLMDEHL